MSQLTVEELRFYYKQVIDLYIDLYTSNHINNPENRPMIEEFKSNSINVSKSLQNCRLTTNPPDLLLGHILDVLQKLMDLVKRIRTNLDKNDNPIPPGFKKSIKKVSFSDSDTEDTSTLNPFNDYPKRKRMPKKITKRVAKNVDSDTETETGNETQNNNWIDMI